MLDGKDAFRYARRRLGFVTYWRCRISDASRNALNDPHIVWRVFDVFVTVVALAAVAHWGNGWLAAGVLVYGLWNFTDGMVRARW